MEPENNGEGISQEFNEAAGETYLSGEFNEAAQGDVEASGAAGTSSSGDEQINSDHDLESDLHSLGGYDDDPELANYQSFADELDALDAGQSHDGGTFQEFQEEQAANDDGQDYDGSWGATKNDPDLSM